MKLKHTFVQITRRLGIQVSRYEPGYSMRCVSLSPDPSALFCGNVLIAYILDPFLLRTGERTSTAHTHYGESVLMAQAFLELGYCVDVIDFRNGDYEPRRRYDFFVSARTNLEHIAARLNQDCVKIAHLDTSHFSFNNQASYARLMAQQRRRGVGVSSSMRLVEHNRAIEVADYAAVLGNTITQDTYRYASKPLFEIPVPASLDYPWNVEKDFKACRNHFLWFGSGSLLHKGLDLTLEAFAETPQVHLTVCGPLDSETEFCRAYQRELHEIPNIQAPGWLDVTGADFRRIVDSSLAVVYPSCAEGQAGSVINAMRAGLIPVVTRETGIDVQDFGVVLEDASVDGVREAVTRLAGLPHSRLREMSQKAWLYTHEHHSLEAYSRAYRAMLEQILSAQNSKT
jgi:glycosyltransferase involved in cell wall biosynthesis